MTKDMTRLFSEVGIERRDHEDAAIKSLIRQALSNLDCATNKLMSAQKEIDWLESVDREELLARAESYGFLAEQHM